MKTYYDQYIAVVNNNLILGDNSGARVLLTAAEFLYASIDDAHGVTYWPAYHASGHASGYFQGLALSLTAAQKIVLDDRYKSPVGVSPDIITFELGLTNKGNPVLRGLPVEGIIYYLDSGRNYCALLSNGIYTPAVAITAEGAVPGWLLRQKIIRLFKEQNNEKLG